MSLQFSTFRRDDFPEYQSWYEDIELNVYLGPMEKNDPWLDAVLQEKDGCHYGVHKGEELVAVVGIKFPTVEHPAYYITDFAMKPHLRSRGLGSEILRELLRLHPLSAGQTWRAFVDVKNPRAKSFFEKNGWACVSMELDKHGMHMLELTDTNSYGLVEEEQL